MYYVLFIIVLGQIKIQYDSFHKNFVLQILPFQILLCFVFYLCLPIKTFPM